MKTTKKLKRFSKLKILKLSWGFFAILFKVLSLPNQVVEVLKISL